MTAELWDYARGVIGLAFALAVVGKALDLDSFVQGIRSADLLPRGRAKPAASAVVALETLTVGLMLPGGTWSVTGLLLAAAQLTGYSAVLVVMLRKGDVRCACFGPATRVVSAADLVRNAVLAAVAVAGVVAWSRSPGDLATSDAVLVLAPAVATVLLLVALDDVVAVVRTPLQAD